LTIEPVIALMLAALTAALLVAWLRLDRRHLWYLAAGIATAAACVLFRFNDFAALSRDLVVLQAGLSDLNIAHVFGDGNHFCRTCSAMPAAMSSMGSHALPIQDAVLLNRVLFIVNIAGFAMAAMAVTRRFLLSVFFAAAVAMVPVVELGFDTNYPSAFLTFLFLVGGLAGALFNAREKTGRPVTAMAVAAVVLATVLAFLTRPETASAGLAALMAMALAGRNIPLPRRPQGWFVPVLVAVIVMAGLEAASLLLKKTSFPVWVVDGLNPLDPSTAHAVADVFMILPLSMAFLVFIGLWHTVRRPLHYLLMPLSAVFLLKTATSASRFDMHTIFRMFSVMTPILLFAAIWGLRAVADFMTARVGDARVRFIITILLIASFGIGTPFARRAIRVNTPPGGFVGSLENGDSFLSMNPQLETRFLVQALDSHPDCTFRSRVMDRSGYAAMNSGGKAAGFVDIWFSRAGVSYAPPDVAPSCLLHYRSLDCAVSGEDACAGLLEGAFPVREVSFRSRPYGNYLLVDYDDPVTIGLYLPQP